MNLALTVPAQDGNASCRTLRMRLREATTAAHARVDARFADGLGGPQAYACYLQGMQRTLVAFEDATLPWRNDPHWQDWLQPHRAALLQADLQSLGLADLPAAPALACAGPGGVLGALYVIEGSAMGARLLRRGLHTDVPTRFLDAQAGAGSRWTRLAALLETHPSEDAAAQAACATALGLFALADDSFRLAAGEPAR